MQIYENSIMFVMVHFCKTCYKHAFISSKLLKCVTHLSVNIAGECQGRLGIQGLYKLYFTTFAVTPKKDDPHTYILQQPGILRISIVVDHPWIRMGPKNKQIYSPEP